jgi:multidrug efflux system membrane fusion protein
MLVPEEARVLQVSRFGLLLIATTAMMACSGSQGAPAKRQGQAGLRVRASAVVRQDVVYSFRALGSLQPDEVVQVTAEVEGPVRDVTFNEGMRVTPETLLARIDPQRYRLEAQRAEASYRKAQADRAQAEAERARREQLANEQLVSAEELNRARQEAERMIGDADAAKAARDIALENQRRSEVRASRAGIVNTKSVETGQFVKSGAVLATIVDASRLRLRFAVSETESLRARSGQEVNFRVAPLGDRVFKAKIYHVGAVADPQTRQVEVLAWVTNPGTLKPGFFAEIELASETHKDALVVPRTAVQPTDKGFVAYVIEDGKARLRTIQRGLETESGLVEVVAGLKLGDSVVTEGSDRLADGVAVQVADRAAAGKTDGAGGT